MTFVDLFISFLSTIEFTPEFDESQSDFKVKIRFSQVEDHNNELYDRSTVRPTSNYDSSFDLRQEEDMKENDDSSLDNINDSRDEDYSQNADLTINKSGTPESVVTSRKLEWDSLADIGYEQEKEFSNRLSTIERIVLQRRNKTNIGSLEEHSKVVGEISLNSPSAQSTPMITLSYSKFVKPSKDNEKYKNRLIIKRKVRNRITNSYTCEKPMLHTKKNVCSTVNEDEPSKIHDETLKAKIPIAHKKRELFTKEDNELSKSNYISSQTQTSGQTSIFTDCDSNVSDILSKTPVILNVSQLNKKPSTYVIKRKMPKISFKQPVKVQQTSVAEKKITRKFQDVGMNTDLDKNFDDSAINESLLSTANSFEFVPGYMLNLDDSSSNENNVEIIEDDKDSSNIGGDEECMSQNTESDLTNQCSNHTSNQHMISSSHSSNMPSDRNIALSDKSLYSNTELIASLVNLRHKDPVLRDRLTKKIADLLSSTDRLDSDDHSSRSYVANKYKLSNTTKYTSKDDTPYLKMDNQSSVRQKENSTREVFVQTVSDMGTNTDSVLDKIDKNIKQKARITTNIISDTYGAENVLPEQQSSEDHTCSSDYSTDVQSHLKKIDEEISHLLMLKLKLKNKYKSKSKTKGNNDSTNSRVSKNTVLSSAYTSSSVKTTSPRRNSNVDPQNLIVPPLNIKSSSEESINYNENSTISSKVEKCSKDHSKIGSTSSQSFALNIDTKQNTNELDSLAKKSHENEKRTYRNTNVEQTTFSVPLCKCSSMNPLSLCSHSSNFFKSSSLPTTSEEISNVLFRLQKMQKVFSHYNKCKDMKAFLSDYENLIKKYHNKKTSEIKSKSDENSVRQSLKILNSEESKNTETSTNVTLKTNGNSLSEKIIISSDEVKSTNEHISSRPSLSDSKSLKQGLQNSDQILLNEIIVLMKKFESQYAPKIDNMTQIPSSQSSHLTLSKENTDSKMHSSEQNIKHTDIVKLSCKDVSTMTAVFPVNVESKSHSSSARSIKIQNENKPLISATQKKSSRESSIVQSESTNHKYTKEVEKPDKKEHLIIYCTNDDVKLKCACQKLVKKCKACHKKDLETRICRILQNNIVRKDYPNPIAYDLILQPSDSILNETSEQHKRKSLERVIVKIPSNKKKNSKNVKGALHQKANSISEPSVSQDSNEISTDEQLKEFSSLNDEHSSYQKTNSLENRLTVLSDSLLSDEVPKNTSTKITALTLQEYLKKNRPYSFNRMYQRQEILRQLNKLRNQKNENLRKLLISVVSKYPDIKNITESDLCKLIDGNRLNIFSPEIKRLFNTKQVIQDTAFRYKKLPEIVSKKEAMKKQNYMKSNKLLAELFVKKLQKRTLKGIVNISQSSDVISL